MKCKKERERAISIIKSARKCNTGRSRIQTYVTQCITYMHTGRTQTTFTTLFSSLEKFRDYNHNNGVQA